MAIKIDLAADAGSQLDTYVRAGRFKNLHAVVLLLRGERVLERYYEGADERWGRPLGQVTFTSYTLHDLRSVTKSVVGILYGIALAEGAVPPPDALLRDHLPRHAGLLVQPHHHKLTVAHALSMQLGLKWDESLPYSDPRNSEHAMERASDRCRFTLEQPFAHAPGTKWTYCGGATALLAYLITSGAKTPLPEFARLRLFSPMGIEHVEWVTGGDGAAIPASGLRMRPRDLARLGQLVLNRGIHDGAQLVLESWLDISFTPHARVDGDLDYGYHWYVAPRWSWVVAFGNGGQRLTIMPEHDLALVVTAGNYDDPEAWKIPVSVLTDVVLPLLDNRME